MADHRQHPRNSTDDVFDDEYAVDDHYDGIADGFAPGRVQPANDRWSIHSEDPSIHTALPHMSDAPRFSVGSSRNSMHKPRHDQNPFSSNEDDDDDNIDERSALHRSSSIQSSSTAQYAPGIAHRLSTASSARVYARTASPIPGTTGPSHPYSMYPQDTNVARHSSTSTTASTVRAVQSTAASNQGPTHPYSMYPQNVSEHDIVDSTAATNHAQTVIPVGFPGRTQAFARTRGPGDEEQDIIGVDGHSEQLPPYSEYPEDGVPKPIVLPGAAQTATPPSGPQVLMPLMQQQRQPESMSDQAAAHGFAEMQQLNSTDSYGASSEAKSWKEKSWKEKRKTRFCGIPFWWILLSLCVLAFIAIVLGAAIGGIFAGARKEAVKAVTKHNGTNTTTLLDASPIPTSSIGAPPPTGVYALDFGAPRATQSACIANQNYSAAWTCNIYGIPQMAINIGLPPDGSDNEGASLYGFSNATGINYGTQPPNTHFAPFISVEDDDEPYRGPAFYFQTFYDKFVVVPEASLPASGASNPQKRSLNNPDWFTQHQVAAGDKPWFCWFNGTFLEGFIYANNYTDPSQSTSSSASSSTSSSPNSKHAKTSSSPLTTSTIIEVSGPSTTATLTSAYQTATYTHSASSAYTHGSNKRRAKREWQLEKRSWSFAELSSFGYVVKIEERRVPDSVQPYCQQFQILDNGMAGPLVDPGTGQQITVYLQETDPDYSAYQQETYGGAAPTGSSKVKRDPINGACHCEWWSGSSPNS